MMDFYTHLDMTAPDPVEDLQRQMSSAVIDRALIVETWGKDNSKCIDRMTYSHATQFRVGRCFRPEEGRFEADIIENEMVVALRVKTADIRHLGSLLTALENNGKWLLTHAEAGIGALKDELLILADRHPRLRIYLPHLGWPRRDGVDDNEWEASISALSVIPNIVAGISAIGYFSREHFPHVDVEPFAKRLIEVFGRNRIVIGSDYPLLEKNTYAQSIRLAQGWLYGASAPDKSLLETSLFTSADTIMP
jgi:hypothetical protein